MKYIVSANTYTGGYGAEITFFGIFDTKQEAIDYIMSGPVDYQRYFVWEDIETYTDKFDFFEYYYKNEYYKTMTKEEYIDYMRYITEFDNFPVYLGGYCE